MEFHPHFLTSHVGSVPHLDGIEISDWICKYLDIPAWTQHPRKTFLESIYVQYSHSLPAIVVDGIKQKISFDTGSDITQRLETFYTNYLADDIDSFALSPEYASGFFTMLETLQRYPGEWAKGQVIGPISFGLTITDQNLRASIYNEMLEDVIVKNMAMNARWQIHQMHNVRPNIIIFVDEPYMASYGSAFISLRREQVISNMNEVIQAIHNEGALAGTHCCGNTDWSVLLSTQVDILNLDAYSFMETLSLYPVELRQFLDRGGIFAWGIVPTSDEVYQLEPSILANRLLEGFELISQKSRSHNVHISPDDFANCSILTPSCGFGTTSIKTAELVFETLVRTAGILKK